jgi:AcrR family transcriptional regulator
MEEAEGPARKRPGRTPGAQRNREGILDSARREFAEKGYEGATIRRIAAGAGVDAALVHQFFGTKEGLMLAAFRPRVEERLPQLTSGEAGGLGDRLIRTTFEIYGSDFPGGWATLIGLLKSAASSESAAHLLRESFQRGGIGQLVEALGLSQPELRVALISSELFGLTMARFVVRMPPVDGADVESIVSWYGPTLNRYLAEDGLDETVTKDV